LFIKTKFKVETNINAIKTSTLTIDLLFILSEKKRNESINKIEDMPNISKILLYDTSIVFSK
jgi:hypothetical protein